MSEFKTGALVICKGGTPNPWHRQFAGTVHRLGERVGTVFGEKHWLLEPPTIMQGVNLQWNRKYLRLLGDPDDGVSDETLTWLPVPAHEGVPV